VLVLVSVIRRYIPYSLLMFYLRSCGWVDFVHTYPISTLIFMVMSQYIARTTILSHITCWPHHEKGGSQWDEGPSFFRDCDDLRR
jgi:hypothetical protein